MTRRSKSWMAPGLEPVNIPQGRVFVVLGVGAGVGGGVGFAAGIVTIGFLGGGAGTVFGGTTGLLVITGVGFAGVVVAFVGAVVAVLDAVVVAVVLPLSGEEEAKAKVDGVHVGFVSVCPTLVSPARGPSYNKTDAPKLNNANKILTNKSTCIPFSITESKKIGRKKLLIVLHSVF